MNHATTHRDAEQADRDPAGAPRAREAPSGDRRSPGPACGEVVPPCRVEESALTGLGAVASLFRRSARRCRIRADDDSHGDRRALARRGRRHPRARDPRPHRDGGDAPQAQPSRRSEPRDRAARVRRRRRERPLPPRPRVRPQLVRGGGGGGLAVATSTAMVCPTCRTEYHGMTYCTRDARRLVPPEEMLGGPLRALTSGKSAGLVCMACRRAYEPGLRSCPHDGNELVPFPVYNATRPRARRSSTRAGRRGRAHLPGVRHEVRSQRALLRPRRRRARRDQLTRLGT